MDAFYAAVEQRDFPKYRGKPLIVGGDPQKRGVVATCSYEARVFGIHSAMPAAHAYRLCPQAIFIRPRFEVYRQVSREIHQVLRTFSELMEPVSLDEAYLDVSETDSCQGSATLIAREIKQRIVARTRLTASAGVSYNKFLAKLASDMDKPDGLYVITPEQGAAFVETLPIGRFHGIGKATEAKMKALGVHTGAHLKQWPLERLQQTFGKVGTYFYHIARGVDERPIENRREHKSIGSETTFDWDLENVEEMLNHLRSLAAEVVESLKTKSLMAYTLTIKVKYADFQQITRSRTLEHPLQSLSEIVPLLALLLERTEAGERKVRLLGVTVSNLTSLSEEGRVQQLVLF